MAVRLTVYGTADMRQIDRARESLNRLEASVRANSAGIQGSLARAGASLQTLGGRMSSAGASMTRNLTLPIAAAGYALARFTEAAAEDAKSQTVLATTLRNTAGATDATIASTEAWITAQQKALGVTDDQLRPALGILASATGDVAKAQDLASLALDLSAARGIDAETAAKALAKAYAGNTGSLSRLVPGISAAALESGKFTDIQAALADMVGGTAAKAADTQAGKMQRAKVAMQEATEQVGYAFLPVMEQLSTLISEKIVPAIERAADWFGKLSPEMRNAILIGAGVVAALGPVLSILGAMSSGIGSLLGVLSKLPVAWLTALGPIGLVIGAVAALLAFSPGLRGMLVDFLQNALKALAPLWSAIQKALQPVIAAFQQLVKAVLPPLVNVLKAVLPPVITVISAIIKALVPVITVVIKIIAQWITIWLRIATVVAQIVGSIISFVAKLAGAIAKWVAGIISWFVKLSGKILAALGNAGSWLLDIGKRIVDGLLNGLKNAWKNVTDWLGGMAGGLVDKVKDVLGISSPSRVFAGIGENIGDGLRIGLENTAGAVTRAAAGVAAAATISANVTAGMGIEASASALNAPVPASSSASAAPITIAPGAIVITINGNADGAAVGSSVDEALRKLLREVRSL